MSEFERELKSFRLEQTRFGETLQGVASRLMGDANRWPELVWINDLIPPFLTDDASLASEQVLLTGDFIRVPATTTSAVSETDFSQIFARDCGLYGKRLAANADGDFAIASGVDNLSQQLRHGVNTPRGQQTRHPQYGCMVWSLFGKVNGPTAATLGAEYVRATVAADYRISKVLSAVADVSGDSVKVVVRAEAIAGGVIDLTNENPDQLLDTPTESDQLVMSIALLHEMIHITLPTNINGRETT